MLALTALLAGTDLYLKEKAEDAYDLREWQCPGGFLRFRKHHNSGFVLNKLENQPDTVKYLSTGAAGAAAAGWIYVLFRGNMPEKAAFSLLLAGAISNQADRLRKGYVMDYISLAKGPGRLKRLIFNLADVYIAAGAGLGLIAEIFKK